VGVAEQRRRDAAMLARFARTRDARLRNELVLRFLPLARQVARRHATSHVAREDLVQIATLGLIKAIDRFDPEQGAAFSSYAVPTIAGEIRRYIRDHSWTVRPPRDLQELVRRIDRMRDELNGELGRAPTAGELAARLDVGIEDVLEGLQAGLARGRVSFEQPLGDEGETVASTLGEVDAGLDHVDTASTVEGLLMRLSDRDRRVVLLRFREDLTQREIGARVGVSQMQVSRILRSALITLREEAG
jgi:RNA polymerase sigma-B factor